MEQELKSHPHTRGTIGTLARDQQKWKDFVAAICAFGIMGIWLWCFALRWWHFTLSILHPLLQVWMKGFRYSVLSKPWRSMWTAPAIGGNIPSCWYVSVLAAVGLATSKHRISHWVRDAISLDYEVHGLSSPLSVRAHSTRSYFLLKLFLEGSPKRIFV